MTAEHDDKAAVRRSATKPKAPAAGRGSPEVASALRTAYEEAVREEVPDEFIDLLNKLS